MPKQRYDAQHAETVRSRARTSALFNRLQSNALGELKNHKGEEIEMTPGQIRSAEICLKKTLADLAAIQLSLDGEAAIKFVAELPAKSASPEAWLKEVKGDE